MLTNGNLVAAVAILLWPVVAVALYRALPVAQATLWTVLGGLLVLPSGVAIKLPMIPAIDKFSVPNVCIFVGVVLLSRAGPRLPRGWGAAELLLGCFVFSPLVTALLNSDAVIVGDRVLPGVGAYDGVSTVLSQLLLVLSFIVGRRLFGRAPDVGLILSTIAVAGAFYALPMLFEIRFSPQLSQWIYGFSSSSFVVEMRYGGYRPVVFMQNGLAAAFFLATAFLSAAAIGRARMPLLVPVGAGPIQAFLGVVVVLCKSAGALVYSAVAWVLVRWFSARAQMRVALLLVCIALSYPVLRLADLFPTDALLRVAATFNQERADSLGFRFEQESRLISHAAERIYFGWGRYGRNRVYSSSTGDDESITDGLWIITLGQFGLVGFVAQFGLLALPVFRARRALRAIASARERHLVVALALIMALSLIEQLPNASVNSWTWLLAGALLGSAEFATRAARAAGRPSPAKLGFRADAAKGAGVPAARSAATAPDQV